MNKVKQVSVLLENKPGALGKVTRLFADAGLNLGGLMIAEAVGEGMVRLVADDTAKLERVLKKGKFRYVTDEVLGIDLGHRPGALADAAEKLGEAGINIHYAYATGMTGSKKVMTILKVSDQSKALRVLKS